MRKMLDRTRVLSSRRALLLLIVLVLVAAGCSDHDSSGRGPAAEEREEDLAPATAATPDPGVLLAHKLLASDSREDALKLYSWAIAPLPGVDLPVEVVPEGLTGTAVLRSLERFWPDLDEVVRVTIVRQLTPPAGAWDDESSGGSGLLPPTSGTLGAISGLFPRGHGGSMRHTTGQVLRQQQETVGGLIHTGRGFPPSLRNEVESQYAQLSNLFGPLSIDIYVRLVAPDELPDLSPEERAQQRDKPVWKAVTSPARIRPYGPTLLYPYSSEQPDACVISLSSEAFRTFDAANRPPWLIHEIFHCYQIEWVGLDGWFRIPNWIIEGTAFWVQSHYHPNARYTATNELAWPLWFMVEYQLPERCYDAVGFWATAAEHLDRSLGGSTYAGTNLMRRLPRIFRSSPRLDLFELNRWWYQTIDSEVGGNLPSSVAAAKLMDLNLSWPWTLSSTNAVITARRGLVVPVVARLPIGVQSGGPSQADPQQEVVDQYVSPTQQAYTVTHWEFDLSVSEGDIVTIDVQGSGAYAWIGPNDVATAPTTTFTERLSNSWCLSTTCACSTRAGDPPPAIPSTKVLLAVTGASSPHKVDIQIKRCTVKSELSAVTGYYQLDWDVINDGVQLVRIEDSDQGLDIRGASTHGETMARCSSGVVDVMYLRPIGDHAWRGSSPDDLIPGMSFTEDGSSSVDFFEGQALCKSLYPTLAAALDTCSSIYRGLTIPEKEKYANLYEYRQVTSRIVVTTDDTSGGSHEPTGGIDSTGRPKITVTATHAWYLAAGPSTCPQTGSDVWVASGTPTTWEAWKAGG